ncbi:MAG: N(4)-(beta-N-acetylglucosaminyl)-L-asparaginase [Acidobacteriota bacterium]|nr:N(4)-(beta-N-acetylglucosaminyl)-L-asparaginase [Acidobacteriota bacterium]
MEPIDRRDFMKSVAASAAMSAAGLPAAAAQAPSGLVMLTTWEWGQRANQRAAEVIGAGGSLLDGVEKGINVVEDDPTVMTVGYGGLPNADGVVELDAAIMDGTRHRAGSICNLHMIKNPISVARQVIERTSHTTIAGEGAFQFALKLGFQPQQLLTPASLKKWMDWRANPNRHTYWLKSTANHDTIGMVATDGEGRMAAGCSTSGMAFKIPGRVADSSLVGCGVYADDNAGGASATGDGDLMTNYCTSVSIVRSMARGASPQEACEDILRLMVKTDALNKDGQCAVIAMNKRGETGNASMNQQFRLKYALWRNGSQELKEGVVLF